MGEISLWVFLAAARSESSSCLLLASQGHRSSPLAPQVRGHWGAVPAPCLDPSWSSCPKCSSDVPTHLFRSMQCVSLLTRTPRRAAPAHLAAEGCAEEAQHGRRCRGSARHYHANTPTETRLLDCTREEKKAAQITAGGKTNSFCVTYTELA